MNSEKVRQRFFDGKDFDVELTIKDNNTTIILKLHRFVLMNSCDFFEALLLFPNSNKNNFTIEVPNALVVCDIIASFYGINQNSTNYPEWQYILETFKCKNYLCLPMNIRQLYDLEIPSEGFELFFQVVEFFGDIASDHKLMRSIKRNLPLNYDLTIFTEDFLRELFRKDQLIVSGSYDKSIKIWDTETGECVKTLNGHTNCVWWVAFSSDDKLILSASCDKSIKIWDAETEIAECLKTLDRHIYSVFSVAFSSDNKLILSGSYDRSIKIWDAERGECLKTLEGHSDWVRSVAFSSDNKLILSGNYDKSIKIWDVETLGWDALPHSKPKLIPQVETGECLKTLEGHYNYVRYVAFSSDNKLILSGSRDSSIKIWNAETLGWDALPHSKPKLIPQGETGECLKTLEGHTSGILSAAFSHN